MAHTSKDPLTEAIEKNPCGICRAKRLPMCKCKGGGGGSGGGSEEETYESKASINNDNNSATIQALSHIFESSPLWQAVDGGDDCFTLNHPDALFSITLDLSAGSLVITKRPGLSKEELDKLEIYINKIEDEFKSFKTELEDKGIDTSGFKCLHESGCLIIKIPNAQHFDAFIQTLVDKHLLPTDALGAEHVPSQAKSVQESNTGHNHTPFDTDCAPKE